MCQENSFMCGGLYTEVKGTGEPVLLIHGIISDSSFFHNSASLLSKKFQVISYDRRGYGKSRMEDCDNWSVETQAEDAARIIQELCGNPAWITGYSAGGMIAIELALKHPELVRGLILFEPSLGYDEKENEKLRAWNCELNEYANAHKGKRALAAFARVIGKNERENRTENKKPVSMEELKKTYGNLETFLYGELNEVQHYHPPIELLRSIKVPVVVGVTEDGINSIFATSSLKSAKKIGWPVVFFPGDHNAGKDMPEKFSEKIADMILNHDVTKRYWSGNPMR